MPKLRTGVVSVVLVNFRGADDTLEAVRHLRLLNWPAESLEIVIVDNASGDDSVERLRQLGESIVLVESEVNLGFAGGCNLGVERSTGEFVAFLNNDAKPDPEWVAAAIARFSESRGVGAVASKVLDWSGERVDFIGAALTWYGMGYKPFTGEVFDKSMPVPDDVLFGTGSAMFVRREVFDGLGGFDDRYFMFFEDVDFGWRLNLAGWRFAYAPRSIAFHKHHASMKGFGHFREQYLLERNALFTLYKNLDAGNLDDALPAAMALAVRRSLARGGADSTSLDLRSPSDESETAVIEKDALTGVFGIDQFVEQLPALRAARDRIQSSRKVSDAAIWQLFGSTDVPAYLDQTYLEGYEKVTASFDVLDPPAGRRVMIITGDPIGRKLAGPAIRAWNMAERLARVGSVTLVSLAGVEPVHAPFDVVHVRPRDERAFSRLEERADIIIFQGHAMHAFDSLHTTKKIVVVDIYDPMHLEQLEQGRELPPATWEKQVADATEILNVQLLRGDFFLCASERQKHFYLGQLSALGRINPLNYEGDPHFDHLITVVPFGLSAVPPRHERQVLKGVRRGIGPEDRVILWGGGLYNWFDPKTLIRAVADVARRRDDVKLFFQGTAHPHPGVPEMSIVQESRELAAELGVLDSAVFFNDSWVEYEDRANYLTEADAGVSTHFSHVETTFSFRTRILDYLWAELPMVVTEGDHFAHLVSTEGLGIVVPAENEAALALALEKILFDEQFVASVKVNIRRVREDYTWESVLAPLAEFVAEPRRAPDLVVALGSSAPDARKRAQTHRRSGALHDAKLALHYARTGGPRLVISKVRSRLRRR